MGGSDERTLLVDAYPKRRALSLVTQRKPGRVNPSFRSRTPNCSIAFAIVHVSNCWIAPSWAEESTVECSLQECVTWPSTSEQIIEATSAQLNAHLPFQKESWT
jgi:hypothetical protein